MHVGAIDKSVHTRLLEADTPAVYAASGHLLFVAQATLVAQRFDPTKLTVAGDPIRVADQVSGDAFGMPVSASAAGPIVYRTGSLLGQRQFVWVDRAGKELEKVGDPESTIPQSPSLSADGRRVVLQRLVNGNVDIWWSEIERWGFRRATTDPANDIHARWSHDGSRIIYGSRKKGVYNLYERSLTQPDSESLVFESSLSKRPLDWSSDGRFLLFRHADPKTGTDILALPMDGSARPFPVVTTDAEDTYAQFSPDGSGSCSSRTSQDVLKCSCARFQGLAPRSRSPLTGARRPGGRPAARKSSTSRSTDGSCRYSSNRVTADRPSKRLYQSRFLPPASAAQSSRPADLEFMVAPDGKRLLMNNLTGEYTSPITVILNWKANGR